MGADRGDDVAVGRALQTFYRYVSIPQPPLLGSSQPMGKLRSDVVETIIPYAVYISSTGNRLAL